MKELKPICISLAVMAVTNIHGLQAQTVDILSDGKLFRIDEQTTQTERKAGWRIADIQMKSTLQRYLWGTRAKQLVDSNSPQFIVDTDTLLLSDMVLMKLKKRKQYRKVQAPEVRENAYIPVDLTHFDILPYGEESFLVCPINVLEPGEYIFTWITGPKIGELEDWKVWPFSVE